MAHPDNRFYGHDRVLADEVGLSEVHPIAGMLQHGWTPGAPFEDADRMVRSVPLLAWSVHNADEARQLGIADVVPIGAPFLYLRNRLGAMAPSVPESTIVYPHHGHKRLDLGGVDAELIAAISARERGPVTVSLYWHEYDHPATRRLYEQTGFRVVCHGSRDDPRFLHRQFTELALHGRVVSNRIGTALFYGAALGREVELYGPMAGWDAREIERARRLQAKRWPELVDGGVEGDDARRLAEAELGAESLRAPSELAGLLGWPEGATRRQVLRVRGEHHGRRVAHHARALQSPDGRRYLRRVMHLG